jgi:hypothetical protein
MATDSQLLAEHDLDPDQWVVVNQVFNTWGSTTDPTQEYKQTKLHVAKKRPLQELVLPARLDGPRHKPQPSKTYKKKAKLVCFVGDQHAPFHDQRLHELFLRWLDEHQPHEIVLLGDGGDYPLISRHQYRPEWAAKTQECVNAQYEVYRDVREHAPKARIRALVGNHEVRLSSVLLNDLRELYGLTKASTGQEHQQEAVLGLANLLRLDELGIELVEHETSSTYDNARISITPTLIARHGTKAAKGAGVSALRTLDALTHSLVQGHTHRQAIVSKTIHTADGPQTIYAVETGCMADVGLATGYTTDADWQQGFCTATVYPDDFFDLELARYSDGVLTYRGQRTQ